MYFWNMTTGDLVITSDQRLIRILYSDGYVEVTWEEYKRIAEGR